MIHPNELVLMILGIAVLAFYRVNRQQLRKAERFGLLLAAFGSSVAGWLFTVAEGIGGYGWFNFLEHTAYMVSSGFLAAWCILVFQVPEAGDEPHCRN